jgi:hypothetical protein
MVYFTSDKQIYEYLKLDGYHEEIHSSIEITKASAHEDLSQDSLIGSKIMTFGKVRVTMKDFQMPQKLNFLFGPLMELGSHSYF